MTTRAYIHAPTPPFVRIGGPIAVSTISRTTGLSIDSTADLAVAAEDIELDWIRSGMCWAIDQSDIGEPLWAGFVDIEELPMDSESVRVPLLGPKLGLLAGELAVRLPARVSSGSAVRAALEAMQASNGAIFPGDIEEIGPAIELDVRGESASQFINTIREICSCDWRERVTARASNELQFFLDFGLLKRETRIVLGRNEIVTGVSARRRPVASLTTLSQAAGFADRQAVTIAGGARQSAAQPVDGVMHPQDERVAELLRERDIGPAATRHAVEISERVGEGISNFAMERHVELLRGVEEVTFTLDATKADAQAVQLGDVVTVDVPNWFKTLHLNVKVHIREIAPQDSVGQRDVVASVVP